MKKGSKFNFIEPQTIMALITVLIILAIGVFAVFTVSNETKEAVDKANRYEFDIPLADGSGYLNLTNVPGENWVSTEEIIIHLNDGNEITVSKSDYTWSASNPTEVHIVRIGW